MAWEDRNKNRDEHAHNIKMKLIKQHEEEVQKLNGKHVNIANKALLKDLTIETRRKLAMSSNN